MSSKKISLPTEAFNKVKTDRAFEAHRQMEIALSNLQAIARDENDLDLNSAIDQLNSALGFLDSYQSRLIK